MTTRETALSELASIIRSKNAGPYRVTLDILFTDPDLYRRVRDSGSVTKETVAAAYGIDVAEVASLFNVDMANAIKVTLRRKRPGSFRRDRYVWLPAARAAARPARRAVRLTMRISRPWMILLLGLPMAFLVAFFILPFVLVVVDSLRAKDGGASLGNYAKIFGDTYYWRDAAPHFQAIPLGHVALLPGRLSARLLRGAEREAAGPPPADLHRRRHAAVH